MINLLLDNGKIIAFIGILFAFISTCFFTSVCSKWLPKDLGREFAHDGAKSAGKPRGAGIIFILVFVATAFLFAQINFEMSIYILIVAFEMFTGFFDDAAEKPWGELKKGLLDLVLATVVAVVFLHYNSNVITIGITGTQITLNPIVFAILTIILVWVSINVTNCSDGVDGLSGTLTIITLMTIYVVNYVKGITSSFNYLILVFVVCILGYLWYNATPSKLLMGDAGSRAMGIFISIAALKMGMPFLYIPVAIVLILDGGLGLIKVSLIRFFKIHILKNTRTPLHDHVRKVKNWSNTQTVFRFAIIQIVVSLATVYLVSMV